MENDKTQSQWYVLQALSGQEDRALKLLKNKCDEDQAQGIDNGIDELQIPVDKIESRNKTTNKVVVRDRKRYPGYILIKVRLYDECGERKAETWDIIKGTQGVIGFIGGDKPVQLSRHDIAEMLKSESEAAKPRPRIQYKVGEKVQLKGSAFVGYEGEIESIDNEHDRLKVSVNIFGRSTPVEIGFDEVERPQ